MAMKLVPISLEEYRILFDAGAWVYGHDGEVEDWALACRSDTKTPEIRSVEWPYCYTRVEE